MLCTIEQQGDAGAPNSKSSNNNSLTYYPLGHRPGSQVTINITKTEKIANV